MGYKKISNYLFYLFIFLLPLQTRLILFAEKPEFLGFSIYLSEIILWIALGLWLLSDYKKIKLSFISLLFIFFAGISILWAEDKISAFRIWLYIFEGVLILVYLRFFFCWKREFKRNLINIFLFSLFLVSCFSIWQFFNLGSEAFKWLGLAERGAWNLRDIVILADGGRWLRAYGSFPHPNIFAGYLAVGIILLLISLQKAKPGQAAKQAYQYLIYLLFAAFVFALFVTFSRSAWLGLAVAGGYLIIKNFDKVQIRKISLFGLAMIVSLGIIFSPFIKTRIKSSGYLENKSNTERMTSWRQGAVIWAQYPIVGIGAGNYMTSNLIYQHQPSHNIFLMVLAELGIVGFLIYLFLWRKLWKKANLKNVLILFLIIGLFDHYLWTLYSGQMLFWVGAALYFEKKC